ncbi:phytanoyl-CoA dioxygenase family protein [Opitutales bacterium]|nr:phytanoyl-CoA dioxygenase family protein [Opitutales bacterium]
MDKRKIPAARYGVLEQTIINDSFDFTAEQLEVKGYAVFKSNLSHTQLDKLDEEFDRVRIEYQQNHGADELKALDEHNTVRMPFLLSKLFFDLIFDKCLQSVLKRVFEKRKFILNQQNLIVNPVTESYNQQAWHRDLPYQHFISSRPLAVNALFCLDDFTTENGATFVLPCSHKSENFPSDKYVMENALQITAKRGNFIFLNSMLFHSGGVNKSKSIRRAINNVFSIPYIKQQITIPSDLTCELKDNDKKEIMGVNHCPPQSVDEFLELIKLKRK